MIRLAADAYRQISHLIPELAKFGVVGAVGAVIDLGGSGVLHGTGSGALAAKAIAVSVAMVVTYLGSRLWTFRHRENQSLLREGSLFLVLNVIGLLLAEAVIGLTVYGLGQHGPIAYNAASVVGTGLGTIFRYLSYKRWVFLKPRNPAMPNGSPVPVPVPRNSSGAETGAAIRSVHYLPEGTTPRNPPMDF